MIKGALWVESFPREVVSSAQFEVLQISHCLMLTRGDCYDGIYSPEEHCFFSVRLT
jgi:hypothetical protein